MAEDWAAVAADLNQALQEVGQRVTLHQPATDGTYDEVTETTTGASPPQTHEGSGIEGDAYSAFSISSGVVEAGDVRFFLSPLKTNGQPMPPPVPDSWTLDLGGVPHAIKAVETTKPAGMGVLFELRLRR